MLDRFHRKNAMGQFWRKNMFPFIVGFFIAAAAVNGIGLERGLSNTDGLTQSK